MNDLHWTDEEYLQALIKKREQIISGLAPEFDDDTTPGNKHTTCSWGCQPTGPEIRYRGRKQRCPLDTKSTKELDGNGCFWTCRAFSRKHKTPSREEVVTLYDAAITEATKCDT